MKQPLTISFQELGAGENWLDQDRREKWLARNKSKIDAIRKRNRAKWQKRQKELHDYDPDEPRDPQGKWTTGGGGGEAVHVAKYTDKDRYSYWVTGEGKSQKVGGLGKDWDDQLVNLGEQRPPTFKNDREDWKTVDDAKVAFFGRHGINLLYSESKITKENFLRNVKIADKTLTDLKTRFPGLAVNPPPMDVQNLVFYKSFSEIGLPADGIAGMYDENLKSVSVISDRTEKESPLTGGWAVARLDGLPQVLRHEFGHAFQHGSFKDNAAMGNRFVMAKYSGEINRLSKYAGANAFEWFAESFAAYTHPDYGKTNVRIDPELEKAFRQLKHGH